MKGRQQQTAGYFSRFARRHPEAQVANAERMQEISGGEHPMLHRSSSFAVHAAAS
jgi:hypothetical protein